MGEGGVKSQDGFCSAARGLQQRAQAPVRQKGASLKCTSALLQMKIQQWKENRCDESDFHTKD